MDEAQEKLKLLIEKAQKQKIDLRKIPAIQNNKKLFEVERKFKLFAGCLVILLTYGYFNDHFNSDKVKISFA